MEIKSIQIWGEFKRFIERFEISKKITNFVAADKYNKRKFFRIIFVFRTHLNRFRSSRITI